MDAPLALLRTAGERFADVVRLGPLSAHVAACPGWTVEDLAHHLGEIHRWARLAAATSAPPDGSMIDAPPPSGDADALADWMVDGLDALIDTLTTLDPEAPTWHPFSVPKVAAVWPRRQVHETSVHRWDAESAVGSITPIDAEVAADGIVEWFELIAPRRARRDRVELPDGAVELHLTDLDRTISVSTVRQEAAADAAAAAAAEILIEVRSGAPRSDTDGEIIAGRAEDLLLALWARRELDTAPATDIGQRWFRIGGN